MKEFKRRTQLRQMQSMLCCRDLGIPLVPIPTDARFTDDKKERRVQLVKSMAEKVYKDLHVQDETRPRRLARASARPAAAYVTKTA